MRTESARRQPLRREARYGETPGKRFLATVCLSAACGYGSSLSAFEIERAEPKFEEGEYRFAMTAVLDAPIDAV